MAPQRATGKGTSDKPSRSTLEKRLRASEAEVSELTGEIARLHDRVRELEAESARWRRKARKHRSRIEQVREAAEVAIAEATSRAKKRARRRADVRIQQIIADHPRAEPLALLGAPPLPEPTWTVVQLRRAAREQGIVGSARMRKDELLAVLI